MCDTMVVVGPSGVLFGKNSDRDPNEAQLLEWQAACDHSIGMMLRCTHIAIPQVEHTHAVLLSRPFWMWGAEIGTNEHGVTIGNEAVFTSQPYEATGLTGMDLLRLALERATSAPRALDVMLELLATHGQGGGCGHEDRSFTYHNSFLIADPHTAFVLETAGKLWASEQVTRGVRTISNGLTIPDFAAKHRSGLHSRVAACDVRSSLTNRMLTESATVHDVARALRSHGTNRWPQYGLLRGSLTMPCMHGGGLLAGSSTTASWIADLRRGAIRHWASGTSSPCLSLFKPIDVDTPIDTGPQPTDQADDQSLWWRHERMSRRVMRDPENLAMFLPERDRIERSWFDDPPASQEAFDRADELLTRWAADVDARWHECTDERPWWMRRYWSKRAVQSPHRQPAG